jgi:hypothetical protein
VIYALIFCIAVLRIYARAGQQLNVVDYQWLRVPFFSYLMAAGDFGLWGSAYSLFASRNWFGFAVAVLVYGTAGWIGAVIAMYLHKRSK